MITRILSAAEGALTRLSAARIAFYLRKEDKKLFRLHKDHWAFLTPEELRSVNRRDKYAYAIYKNMAGAENLPYYVSDSLFKTVLLPRLNPLNHAPSGTNRESCFADKNYSELIMSSLCFPKAVFRRMHGYFYDADLRRITEEEALALAEPYEELVFKQSVDGAHGHGVKLVSRADYAALLRSHGENYVAQERVRQHPALSYFNESSVNILRVTSLCWKGEVYILSGILRIGAPGSFCDHTPHGGTHNLDVAVMEDGSLGATAFDPDHCHVYDNVYGKPIQGCIPRYEELKKLVIREHAKYPDYALIGWDFTVDEEENIVCMEFNTKWPGISASQYAHGAIFAQKSREGVPLLDEILASRKKR